MAPLTQNPRLLALHHLCLLERDGYTVSQFPTAPRFDDPRNRALYRELLQGVSRHKMLLDFQLRDLSNRPLKDLDPEVRNALRLGAYQLLYLDKIPPHAAVDSTVDLVAQAGMGKAKAFVNGTLRSFLRQERKEIPTDDLSTRYSFPKPLVEHLRAALAWAKQSEEDLGALLTALNQVPRLCLRVNTLKTSREKLVEAWKAADADLEITPTSQSAAGLQLADHGDLTALPGYREGWFSVQSEASQLIAPLLGPFDRPLEILDACAAPGGKATHLAELTKDQSKITALCAPRKKSATNKTTVRMRENIARLGLTSIEIIEATAEEFAASAGGKRFDRILVDAPCTGLGTIGKHPERKWVFQDRHVAKLVAQQQSILAAVAPLLKDDGVLVYSICSLSVPEWEVATHGRQIEKTQIYWPHQLHSEGLYAALIKK